MRAKDRQKPSFFASDEVCIGFSSDRGTYSYLFESFFGLSAVSILV